MHKVKVQKCGEFFGKNMLILYFYKNYTVLYDYNENVWSEKKTLYQISGNMEINFWKFFAGYFLKLLNSQS